MDSGRAFRDFEPGRRCRVNEMVLAVCAGTGTCGSRPALRQRQGLGAGRERAPRGGGSSCARGAHRHKTGVLDLLPGDRTGGEPRLQVVLGERAIRRNACVPPRNGTCCAAPLQRQDAAPAVGGLGAARLRCSSRHSDGDHVEAYATTTALQNQQPGPEPDCVSLDRCSTLRYCMRQQSRARVSAARMPGAAPQAARAGRRAFQLTGAQPHRVPHDVPRDGADELIRDGSRPHRCRCLMRLLGGAACASSS